MKRLAVLLLCSSCASPPTYDTAVHSNCPPSEALTDKIIACVAAANTKSDEEPEDWIRICGEMTRDAMCPKQVWVRETVNLGFSGGYQLGSWLPCSSAPERMRVACKEAGWHP